MIKYAFTLTLVITGCTKKESSCQRGKAASFKVKPSDYRITFIDGVAPKGPRIIVQKISDAMKYPSFLSKRVYLDEINLGPKELPGFSILTDNCAKGDFLDTKIGCASQCYIGLKTAKYKLKQERKFIWNHGIPYCLGSDLINSPFHTINRAFFVSTMSCYNNPESDDCRFIFGSKDSVLLSFRSFLVEQAFAMKNKVTFVKTEFNKVARKCISKIGITAAQHYHDNEWEFDKNMEFYLKKEFKKLKCKEEGKVSISQVASIGAFSHLSITLGDKLTKLIIEGKDPEQTWGKILDYTNGRIPQFLELVRKGSFISGFPLDFKPSSPDGNP